VCRQLKQKIVAEVTDICNLEEPCKIWGQETQKLSRLGGF